MARVKLTEFRAKTLLVDDYDGVQIKLSTIDSDISDLSTKEQYVIKVDQGVKKRGKQGLIRFNVTKNQAKEAVQELAAKGFDTFLAEPMVDHEHNEEAYLSLERTRDGIRILHSTEGGVDIEDHPDSIIQYTSIKDVPVPQQFLTHVISVMDSEHLSFLEINPLVIKGGKAVLLDAAVLADSAGMSRSLHWDERDIVVAKEMTWSERVVADLNDGSPASFSFRVLNPDGAIWLLLSGGGASITIADEAANQDKVSLIGNYGEYSGGPTREETCLYANAVLEQMLASNAPKRVIVLAGGVANFTDVKRTFAGVRDALSAHIDALRNAEVRVFVRRGGPNESEGLRMIEEFLKENEIYGSVHGSDKVLTTVIDEAMECVDV